MKKDESNEKPMGEGSNLSRRELLRIAVMTGVPIVLLSSCSNRLFDGDFTSNPELVRDATSKGPGPLPAAIINPRSTEICLNSRISYHAGWSGTASDQMLSLEDIVSRRMERNRIRPDAEQCTSCVPKSSCYRGIGSHICCHT